ncbi:hypothetical protein HanRHA438_Chr11g0490411 [Helianthus annuus]|nr:putative WD-repeat protein SPA1/2/3/4 [Helianthus annuus]KAJ0508162.1 hypothetical protein HanIR_Chr11g0514231 [Helianthus annuus]KAJ0688404.1 putative WD-repeat protein SPA1/2/3/4 [Helianthus annuus]KAJ0869554.1 hypothetical protein HanRHA438_Chr11g0490411 [Helianthus annuus]
MSGPRVLSCHRVLFIESVSCSGSGSDELNNQTVEFTGSFSPSGQSGLLNLEGSNVVQPESKKIFPMKQILQMESNWYTSPEEAAAGATSSCSGACDVYRLGSVPYFCSNRMKQNRLML